MSDSCLQTQSPFVVVLAPQAQTTDDTIDYYYDFTQSIAEFTKAFASLQLSWEWCPVTIQDYKEAIDAMVIKHGGKDLLFFNLCDGDEIIVGKTFLRFHIVK